MRRYAGITLIVISGFLLSTCFDPPEYPAEPEIEFEDIVFKDVTNDALQDSLILYIRFKDGDGNLGLSDDENGCYDIGGQQVCYNDKFYLIFNSGPYEGKYLNYAIKRTDPDFSDLPDYVKPYDCINWELVKNEQSQVIDTVYIELNPDHYNIFVDYFIKEGDTFIEYDFREEFCTTYDGRFPILFEDFDSPGPLEGTIKYAMTGVGFNAFFSIKVLKLKIQIQDRLLNKSNIIETPEFTLQSIKK